MTPRRTTAALILALATAVLGACGDDDDAATDPTGDPASATSGGATGRSGGGETDNPLGITDAGDALASVGLESKAFAIETAMSKDRVDRVEVKGDTIHVYLKGDSFTPMMGCMVTASVLSEGEKAVMHSGGEATPCD